MVRGCCRKAVLAALRECKHRINPLCTAALAARCTEVTQVTVNTLADFVDYPDTIADRGCRNNYSNRFSRNPTGLGGYD